MKLILVDPNSTITSAWETAFAELPDVEIVEDLFENIPQFDCMVSAANSFGLMDGGVDYAIAKYFGESFVERVQDHIIRYWHGELPVGSCELVPTAMAAHPWVAVTPTMRIPMDISKTDNTYSAMWAMLNAVNRFNLNLDPHNDPYPPEMDVAISTIACPGLGTLAGKMSPEDAARMMALAWQNFLYPPKEISWEYAAARQSDVTNSSLGYQRSFPVTYQRSSR